MSRRYSLEIIREACALYTSGLNVREVAEEMKRRGHKEFNPETMRRWAHQYNLTKVHTKNDVDSIKAAIIFDSQCAINDLMEAALNTRKKVTEKLASGGLESTKLLAHLKKVDALIVSLANINK